MVWPRQKDARGENTKTNYGMDTTGEKEKRTSKENVDGKSTSSHDNKKFRSRSMEKQRGMAFGLRKTATAIKIPDIRRAQVKVGLINLCKGLFSLNARIYYKLKSGT